MSRVNVSQPFTEVTHEGGPAKRMSVEQALRRSVLSCLLWEKEFYEDGVSIADRITDLASKVDAPTLAALAIEAREQFKLRHVPLLLLNVLTKTGAGNAIVGDTIARVIQRADELTEFLALYWKQGKHPLSKQTKLGLAKAFTKFDAYQLGKYGRFESGDPVKLRDVLFMTHAKPKDGNQAQLWASLVAGKLPVPDTWETQLMTGANKKETFERLIKENNLGYLALLRNLRNMTEAGCDVNLINEAILARKNGANRVLPFRYTAAARAAMSFEPVLDRALMSAIEELPVLKGRTVILTDVSGSMDEKLSGKSDLTRMDAAATLASIVNCENLRNFTFSNSVVEVPPRRGMAGVDAITKSQPHQGTRLGEAITVLNQNVEYDRLIVVTDEQAHDSVGQPKGKAYLINVASYKNGVGYGGNWTHIDGFSEAVINFIVESEKELER